MNSRQAPESFLDAPGHVVVEGEMATARGGEPGAAFTIVDWLGRAVDGAGGVFGNDGAAACRRCLRGITGLLRRTRAETASGQQQA